MKKTAILLLLLGSTLVFSQVQEAVKGSPQGSSSNNTVDKPAEYPEGFGEFRKNVSQKINLKKIKNVKDKVSSYAKFSISTDGDIGDVTVTGSNEIFNKEVEKAILSMKKKWIPASYKETPVKTWFTVPFIANFE